MVKVIVPAHNAAKTIKRTLDSILAQTYQDFRVIVVDDASTDETAAIVTEYTDAIHNYHTRFPSKILLYLNPENMGVSLTRNRALSYLDADFVAYCDADDWWEVDHLEKAMQAFKDNPDIQVVYSNPVWVHENGYHVGPTFPIYQEFNGERFKQGNFIWISTVVHKASDSMQFDPNLNSIEDYDMWIRMYRTGWKFKQLPSRTVSYHVNEAGNAGQNSSIVLSNFVCKHNQKFSLPVLEWHFPVRLHVGCGTEYLDGWINIDKFSDNPKVLKADAKDLPYVEYFADELKSSHVIEHFSFNEGWGVLTEWWRVLKFGGKLSIETPDLLAVCEDFVKGTEQRRVELYSALFAYPDLPGQAHKFLYTEQQLRWTLEKIGFKDIVRVAPDSKYARSGNHHLCLKLEAIK